MFDHFYTLFTLIIKYNKRNTNEFVQNVGCPFYSGTGKSYCTAGGTVTTVRSIRRHPVHSIIIKPGPLLTLFSLSCTFTVNDFPAADIRSNPSHVDRHKQRSHGGRSAPPSDVCENGTAPACRIQTAPNDFSTKKCTKHRTYIVWKYSYEDLRSHTAGHK